MQHFEQICCSKLTQKKAVARLHGTMMVVGGKMIAKNYIVTLSYVHRISNAQAKRNVYAQKILYASPGAGRMMVQNSLHSWVLE